MIRARTTALMLLLGLIGFLGVQLTAQIPERYAVTVPMTLLLGLAAMFLVIAVPALGRTRVSIPMGVTCAVYLILRLVRFDQRPPWGGLETYVAVAEVGLLLGLVFLAHRMAVSLAEFEHTVEELALADLGQGVRRFDSHASEIRTQMALSRRHGRPLSVLVVELDPESAQQSLSRTMEELQKAIAKRHAHAGVVRTFNNLLRRTDLLMEKSDKGEFVIVCPDTDSAGSIDLAQRVGEAARQELGISVRCGRASFPDEALTIDELVGAATPEASTSGEVVQMAASRAAATRIQALPDQEEEAVADRAR